MSNSQPAREKNTQDVIELKDLINMLWPRKWLIFGCVVIALLIGAAICKARIPVYQSNTLISVSGNSNNSLMSSLMGQSSSSPMSMLGGDSAMIASEQSIVTSRSVLEPTIKQLHLDVILTPDYFPIFGHKIALNYDKQNYTNQIAKPWLGMNSYNWGGSSLDLKNFSVKPYWQNKIFKIIYQGNDHYTLIDPKGTSLATGTTGIPLTLNANQYNAITLTISSITANAGAVFYIKQIPTEMALKSLADAIKVSPTGQFANTLNVTLNNASSEKAAAILNTIGFYIVNSSVKQTALQAAEALKFLKKRVPDAEKQLNIAETNYNEYRTKSGHVSLSAQTKMILNSIATAEAQLTQAQMQRAELESQYVKNSLPLQQIDAGIAQYQQQIDRLNQQLRNTPDADQKLVDLTRDATIKNTIYTSLLMNIQRYELVKATTLGTITIIDHADVPFLAINVPAALVLLIAIVLGLLISFMIIFTQHYLRKGVEDTHFVENTLGIPVIATLFDSTEQRRQKRRFDRKLQPELQLMSELDPQSLISESIRSLRTNILFKLTSAKGNIISISGPSPNIGKSFVSANLAHSLAEIGKRVLLIDADARRGDLYHYFKGPHKPGFTDLLMGMVTPEVCVQKTRFAQLDFLPTGSNSHNHAELLMAPSCQTELQAFSAQYDIIIIDTAPILALTDAAILASHATLRLMILGYGQHTEKQLEVALNHFKKVNQTIDGAVFNLIPLKSNKIYDYAQQYYRYDYRSDKSKK